MQRHRIILQYFEIFVKYFVLHVFGYNKPMIKACLPAGRLSTGQPLTNNRQ